MEHKKMSWNSLQYAHIYICAYTFGSEIKGITVHEPATKIGIQITSRRGSGLQREIGKNNSPIELRQKEEGIRKLL